MRVAILAAAALATVALSGCTKTVSQAIEQLNAAIQRDAPDACDKTSTVYTTWLATNPSPAKLAKVNTYYQVIHDLCLNPSQITTEEIALLSAKAYAMKKAMKGT